MLHIKIIDIKENKIKTSEAEAFIKSSSYGASIIFNGTVRNINEDKEVVGMTYDTHDELVLKSFEEIYNEATEKLKITSKSVFIEHRDQAYALSRYIIEEIKKRSPIWKKEHYKNEQSEWLKGNPI